MDNISVQPQPVPLQNAEQAPQTHVISKRLYPIITIQRNQNPNRFWAIPILGGLIKVLITIPQLLMLFFAGLCVGVCLLINVFTVLFVGRYYKPGYNWITRYINLDSKIVFFTYGLTDKYPGFSFAISDSYKLDILFPATPNRLFAVPLIGFVARFILLFPFLMYINLIYNAAWLMVISSPLPVLFKKYYPESTFEMAVDATRLRYASILYFFGVSDTYPTYKISKNHLAIKLIFITVSALYFLFSFASGFLSERQQDNFPSNFESQYPSDNFNNFDYGE